ncbi:ATP-grasp domain-containing protein [Paenibacillus macerans]|uniref:ATP-grasp domain-containing protein n=1 Tax=Paenibacillus macerans TaxID=44252 RepID=UPI00203EAE2F|nr:ATP-grasp domain-containing protein [Paenibacillus macerans]MCM3701843.1 ATP-grasp domain-containing protein [Paenibacillus macerans]
MTTRPLRILLTGGRAPVALELARLLHLAGHRVYAAESARHHLCRRSAAVERSFHVPPPRQQSQDYLAALEAVIEQWDIDLLIPLCEEIFVIAGGAERLKRRCRVLVSPLELLHEWHHKYRFVQRAASLGLPVPPTTLLNGREAWQETMSLAASEGRQVVLKPAYSRFASRVIMPVTAGASTRWGLSAAKPRKGAAAEPPGERLGRSGGSMPLTSGGAIPSRSGGSIPLRSDRAMPPRSDLAKPHRSIQPPPEGSELSETSPWVAQDFIAGRAICTYSVVHEGCIVAHAAYGSRYRTGKTGASVHFEYMEHEGASEWVRRFLDGTRFCGQIGFDLIEQNGGELYGIECNPRTTSGVHLFEPGIGLERALLSPEELAAEGAIVRPRPGSKAMLAMPMLGCGWRELLRGELGSWLGALRGTREVIFRADDFRPWLEQAQVVYDAFRTARRLGITLTEALTYDIEWNGEPS